MPLQPGTTLGPYAVTAKIGAGGMGEVYRAHDTKLDRDVALKVLPQAFTEDPDRLARFEREAKVLASLNHPNIGGIYGLEESDGVKALVLTDMSLSSSVMTTIPMPTTEVVYVPSVTIEREEINAGYKTIGHGCGCRSMQWRSDHNAHRGHPNERTSSRHHDDEG